MLSAFVASITDVLRLDSKTHKPCSSQPVLVQAVLAAQVACLGVPDAQWAALGHAALQALQLEVASKAFGRIKETSYLRLLHQLEQARKAGQPAAILKADVLAYQVH